MPSKMVRYKKDEAYLTTNKWPIRHMKDRRALRVHSDPLAGCGPCGRPPLQDNQFPILGADGHKGRALQMAILLIPSAALDNQTYIPILLQGAALVAVRHGRVTNFPSWVRMATRAAPCKWTFC